MDWHLRCKVQNELTLIQRDYVTHQPATPVSYSLHRMALPCSECGIIGPESPTSLPHIATKTLHERCISMASPIEPLPDDSLDGWFRRYQQLAVLGVRSAAVAH